MLTFIGKSILLILLVQSAFAECLTCGQVEALFIEKNTQLLKVNRILEENTNRLKLAKEKKQMSAIIKINSNIFVATTRLEVLKEEAEVLKRDRGNCGRCKK